MFAEKLKNLRALRKITQEEFAREINVTKGAVAMWETGKRTPDIEMLKKIASYFKVSVDELIGNDTASNNTASDNEELPEELVILNRNAKKMSPEKRQKLLELARIMFEEDFDE